MENFPFRKIWLSARVTELLEPKPLPTRSTSKGKVHCSAVHHTPHHHYQ